MAYNRVFALFLVSTILTNFVARPPEIGPVKALVEQLVLPNLPLLNLLRRLPCVASVQLPLDDAVCPELSTTNDTLTSVIRTVGGPFFVKAIGLVQNATIMRFTRTKGKGKKQSVSAPKKVVLLSGTPGIGKTISTKLVSQMLGFHTIEVNASDSRGKADKTILTMDEVNGMSAGDRGGVADLIAGIKMSKIPIICICNDQYSQKLKSLVNYCLLLSFRKSTKQQIKRLSQIANSEGLHVNEIALEELAERVNGDMHMALNQLQYMSLSMSVIKFDDIKQRLQSSSKDEDISPFTTVDKLFAFNGGKLRMDERIDLSMSDPDLVEQVPKKNNEENSEWLVAKRKTLSRDEKQQSNVIHERKAPSFQVGEIDMHHLSKVP
ncbi:hypothetical protein BUALT_Bualt12G0045700 [Buddleja alternifolia]|uniref:ATPase AAA-type core domain-containing protein n=1 Tax=Buddleja alternifolia TaxID=168488 RepID=A0AAV6WP18_9LAMI|nr:hypothetical protein BUALT_Bualt12G0045700 [Buddleja alternifolia]